MQMTGATEQPRASIVKPKQGRGRPIMKLLGLGLSLLLVIGTAACGDEEPSAESNNGAAASTATWKVLLPVNSPIIHGLRVAESQGYFEEEGLQVQFEFMDGGGEVVQQFVAGTGEVAWIPLGNVVEAVEAGQTDLRAVFNVVYGSIFGLAVPEDSEVQTAADLEGKRIGISDLAGGEVPTIRGILGTAGLTEQDVEIVPIGEGTALAVRALNEGKVDAVGGAVNDIIAIEVQRGAKLRQIVPPELTELPSAGLFVQEALTQESPDLVEGFLRAAAKGFYWAEVDPEATLALLKQEVPEQFTDATGEGIYSAILPLTRSPEGELYGSQTPEKWQELFDFVGAEAPDADLDELVVDDFVEPANEFEREEVEADVQAFLEENAE